MEIKGNLMTNGIIAVKAVFIGRDGSMGFRNGQEYSMWYFHKDDKYYMSKPSMYSTSIPYATLEALKRNWKFV